MGGSGIGEPSTWLGQTATWHPVSLRVTLFLPYAWV